MNYQKELEKLIHTLQKEQHIPKLLLHSCCAPCSSYVLEYLSDYFEITVFYYNPNIFPENEYTKRILEQQTLIHEMKTKYPISFIAGNYDRELFYEAVKGLEHLKEGGERCFKCYELRLRETARIAKECDYDYFTTTLSISPLKNADKLNQIGNAIASEYGLRYLQSDFKKKMDINVPLNFLKNMDCTVKTTADASFLTATASKRHPSFQKKSRPFSIRGKIKRAC